MAAHFHTSTNILWIACYRFDYRRGGGSGMNNTEPVPTIHQILNDVFILGMKTAEVMQKDHGLPDKKKMLEPYEAQLQRICASEQAKPLADFIEYWTPVVEEYPENTVAQQMMDDAKRKLQTLIEETPSE
jgi:hypothetical protein